MVTERYSNSLFNIYLAINIYLHLLQKVMTLLAKKQCLSPHYAHMQVHLGGTSNPNPAKKIMFTLLDFEVARSPEHGYCQISTNVAS